MEVDLRKTKTICVSLDSAIERRKRCSSLFERLGFADWSFFDAKRGVDAIEGCALSHIDILSSYDFSSPLLLVEDDICDTSYYTNLLNIPDNTDALYVGYSWWGWEKSRAEQSFLERPTSRHKEGSLFRIDGMLSTHAILYVSKRYAEAAVVAMKEYLTSTSGNRHCDVAVARIQSQYNVYATPKHLFFQMCPHNTLWTNRSIQ